MTMIWGFTAQMCMIAIAYPAACLAAAAFAMVLVAEPSVVAVLAHLELATRLAAGTAELSISALMDAFWPTVLVAFLFESLKVRGLLPHLVAGCCVGLVRALPLADGALPMDTPAAQLSVAAGAVGGLVYWAIAGRSAGRWLELRWFAPSGW